MVFLPLRIMKLESTISANQFSVFILGIDSNIFKQTGRPLLGLRNIKKKSSLKCLGRGISVDQGLTRYLSLVWIYWWNSCINLLCYVLKSKVWTTKISMNDVCLMFFVRQVFAMNTNWTWKAKSSCPHIQCIGIIGGEQCAQQNLSHLSSSDNF